MLFSNLEKTIRKFSRRISNGRKHDIVPFTVEHGEFMDEDEDELPLTQQQRTHLTRPSSRLIVCLESESYFYLRSTPK